MKRASDLAFILVALGAFSAEAHLVGTSPWCLVNSPVHYECFFYEQNICEKAAQKRSSDFETWQCLPYPPNFADFPKTDAPSPTPGPAKKKAPTTR